MDLLRKIGIRHRIIAGFTVAFILLATVSALQFLSFQGVNITMREVVEQRQPRALGIKSANEALLDATSQLGFFAATGEPELANSFFHQVAEVRRFIEEQGTMFADNPEVRTTLREISANIGEFRELGERIVGLGEDQEANYPGVAYANAEINPITRRMMQESAGLVDFEVSDGVEDGNQAQRLGTYSDLRAAIGNLMRAVRGYLAFRSNSQAENTLTYLDQIGKLLERIAPWSDQLTFEQAEYVATLGEDIAALRPHVIELLEIHGSEQWRTDIWLIRHDVLPLLADVEHQLDALVAEEERGIAAASDGLLGDAATATLWSTWITILGLLAGIIVAMLITRSIARPICAASRAMVELAEGEGDLTRRLAEGGSDEISRMAQGFNGFVAYVEKVISQTAKTARAVIGGVATTNEASDRIADRIVRQQEETDQVASAIMEMSTSIAEVAQRAAKADEAARGALEEARQGKDVVIDTASGIQTLADRLTGGSELVNRLDADAQVIGSVVDVIRGIAEQTNLLALNAAIEAARAGASGRGFAVVADEVRTLANRTHTSTVEIEGMITRLGASAGEAVGLMSTGSRMAEANAVQAQRAIGALSSIESAVQTISGLNGHIALAMDEQRSVTADIHRVVEHVGEAGRQNAKEAACARETSVHLGELIGDLQTLVGRFKISGAAFDFEKAKIAHLAWRARVRNFLDGKSSLQPQEVVSHRDCVLGKWYYGDGLAKYGEFPEMRALEEPHMRLHSLIREIVEDRHKHGNRNAEQQFGELAELSATIVSGLDKLEAQITAEGPESVVHDS